MAQASAEMGIPKATLRRAKSLGAPGFIHSRVDGNALLPWLEAKDMLPKATTDAPPEDSKPKRTLGEEIEDLDVMLAQVDRSAKASFAAGDIATALQILEQRKPLSDQRNNALTQARRAGRTEDDVIGRAEAIRLIRALAIQACHGIQRIAREAAGRLVGVVEPAEIMRILVEELTANAFLRPFEEAAKLDAGHGIPAWVAEEMRTASGGLVE